MRSLFRAVGAMLRAIARATKTVAVWCARTGMWTAKTVVDVVTSPFMGGGGGEIAPEPTAVHQEQKASTSAVELERVKRLAVGLASGHAPAALFEDVPDSVVDWLGAMDREMLCKVVCAKDAELAAHLSRKETMKKVLPFDKKAIDDYRAATVGRSPEEPEPGYEPELRKRPMLAAA